ncbi:hypothetical protein CORC01_02936 [Colletotrichum orchidophilum]|uniref:Zn(2)-C6 fungal-type domain-containing protein n=1 Tax=Colletotrichum orchidophilum TaxID=1209926 RepID=A0A1G4BK85_9PEZI|nr:uncharacterized protein CORC01_02936 [Colletotrichum orchidophilum]OHF01745.1 hypothetical protein CORC01_02936 [Colletotrichum orchidophilum]
MSLPAKRRRVILPAPGAKPSGSLPPASSSLAAAAASQQPSASGRGSTGGSGSSEESLLGNDPGRDLQSRSQSIDSFSADAKKPSAASKRQVIAVACDNCRRRKAKCDGHRPKCQHCSKRGVECHYEANQGETVSLALKRKANDLETENVQYRDLFRMVCTKSEDEAKEIFRRIRQSGDPLRVLESIRQAEILLPSLPVNDRISDSRLVKLNEKAMENSVLRVPAKPWTTVADDGIVSELITDFFSWDNAGCFPAVEQNLFLEDMRSGDIKRAKWCSPILVNAMCAVRAPFVATVKQFHSITGQDLARQFREEVMQLVEKSHGRASIPTILALVLVDWSASIAGDEASAKMYRFMAWERYKRFKPERRFAMLNKDDPNDAIEMLCISKAKPLQQADPRLGSRVSYFYHSAADMPPPSIPRLFDNCGRDAVEPLGNVDILGRPYLESTNQIPLVPGMATVVSNLACLQYDIMSYLTSGSTIKGSIEDVRRKKHWYCRLQEFRLALPKRFQIEYNLTPATCFLRMHENEIAYAVLQSLSPSTIFDTPYTTPSTTVKSLCLQHCISDTTLAEAYLQRYCTHSYITRLVFVAMQNLMPYLNDTHAATNDLFTRLCMMGGLSARVVRMSMYLLQAVQAMAWAMKQDIPAAARPYLDPWVKLAIEDSETKAPSYAVPDREEIKALLADEDQSDGGSGESGAELWALVERWALSTGKGL